MSELGTWLIRAREARGLTIEDAERDTRISRRYLQALESEQFEVIPAPVYARGFLRSYSQYLGLDPAEMLALFPRDDHPPAGQTVIGATRPAGSTPQQRPGPPPRRQPPSAVGPARPTWRRPGAAEESIDQPQETLQGSRRPATADPAELPLEPMIGVDIGVPAPARRIKTDPAAQQRSMLIAAVAIGVVVVVIIFAYLLSSLGGGSTSTKTPAAGTQGGFAPSGTTSINGAGTAQAASPVAGGTASPSRTVAPGTSAAVPNVIGMTADNAKAAITAAGFKVNQLPASNSAPKGQVFSQSPAPGAQYSTGLTVNIAVSTGS